MRWVHLGLTVTWALLAIPTALWWKDSILWVGEMSVYACMMTHLTSFYGASAHKEIKDQAGKD